METLTLTNGTKVDSKFAKEVFSNLLFLWEADPIAAHELLNVARDIQHVTMWDTGERMRKAELAKAVKDNKTVVLDATIRQMILAATKGEGKNLSLNTKYLSQIISAS